MVKLGTELIFAALLTRHITGPSLSFSLRLGKWEKLLDFNTLTGV